MEILYIYIYIYIYIYNLIRKIAGIERQIVLIAPTS